MSATKQNEYWRWKLQVPVIKLIASEQLFSMIHQISRSHFLLMFPSHLVIQFVKMLLHFT